MDLGFLVAIAASTAHVPLLEKDYVARQIDEVERIIWGEHEQIVWDSLISVEIEKGDELIQGHFSVKVGLQAYL
jgi:hypothetical protein